MKWKNSAGFIKVSADNQNSRTPIEVSAALLFKGGRLLIARRHKDVHLGGLWEFPGGKRHPGESFQDCLKREVREELGIEVAVGELLYSITHKYPDRVVHIRFFLCSLVSGDPMPIDCADIAWVNQSELLNYKYPEADACIINLLANSPQLWEKEN